MAQMTQEELNAYLNGSTQRKTNDNQNNITFFKLEMDGQEALVRFMIDSREDFEVLSMHEIPFGNGTRRINCLKENCPICKSSIKFTDRFHNEKLSSAISSKIYVRLIEYVRHSDGTVTAVPHIWERPISFARDLASYLDTYGPLSNLVMQVKRNGTGTSTTYPVMYLPQDRFPESIYVKEIPGLRNYRALGRFVLNKTAAECETYIATGTFPQAQAVAPTTNYTDNKESDFIEWNTSEPAPAPQPQYQAQPQYQQKEKEEVKSAYPWEATTTTQQTRPTPEQSNPLPWEVGSTPQKPARYF